MRYRNLHGTDLALSEIGFGTWTITTGWWGTYSDTEAERLIRAAINRGVNYIDTADAYGNGRGETVLAPVLRDHPELVIGTKFGYDFYSDPGEEGGHRERKQDFSGRAVRFEVEQSLKRMKIDCIDLLQAHNLKLPQFSDEMFEALDRLKTQGKIRQWGVALGPAIGWREEGYQSFIERDAAVVQTVFNMYEQDPGREFCEIAHARGRGGVIARVPTNSGILDEEFTSPNHQFPQWDHRKFRDRNWLIYGLKKNEIIRPLARRHGLSIRQLSFAWLASFPTLVSIEPNLLKLEDVQEFAAAADAPALPRETLEEIERLYESDFNLGEGAHPCDWKSSVTESGTIRSEYRKPELEGVGR